MENFIQFVTLKDVLYNITPAQYCDKAPQVPRCTHSSQVRCQHLGHWEGGGGGGIHQTL